SVCGQNWPAAATTPDYAHLTGPRRQDVEPAARPCRWYRPAVLPPVPLNAANTPVAIPATDNATPVPVAPNNPARPASPVPGQANAPGYARGRRHGQWPQDAGR